MKNIILLSILIYSNVLFAQDVLIPYRSDKLWGYANTDGKIVIKPEYTYVYIGRNFDRLRVSNNEYYGIINAKGKTVIPVKYLQIYDIKNEGFIVKNDNGYYFYSYKGKLITKKAYKNISYKSPGIINLYEDSVIITYDYVKKREVNKINPKDIIDDAEIEFDDFEDNYSYSTWVYEKVSEGNRYKICKHTTNTTYRDGRKTFSEILDTLEYKFDDVNVCNYNSIKLAFIKQNEKWGIFYDNKITKPQFDEISAILINDKCVKYFFIVRKKDKWGVVDIDGNIKINIEYDEILHPELVKKRSTQCFNIENGIIVRKAGQYGLINFENKFLLDCKFNKIEYDLRNSFYQYYLNDKKGIFRKDIKTDLIFDKNEILGNVFSVKDVKLINIKYKNGKLKGYVSLNGISFYKD